MDTRVSVIHSHSPI